jgi:hypothetical protein
MNLGTPGMELAKFPGSQAAQRVRLAGITGKEGKSGQPARY